MFMWEMGVKDQTLSMLHACTSPRILAVGSFVLCGVKTVSVFLPFSP